jgi:hypothetical protein
VTIEYATSYSTPPSLVFVASAWVPPGPGADGSWNGNAVALTGAGDVDVEAGGGVAVVVVALELGGAVDAAVVSPGLGEKVPTDACDGSGAEPDTIPPAGLPLP